MENPATHGKAEKVVSKILNDFFDNQERAITDPAKTILGLSLERQITDALRKEGLLAKEESLSFEQACEEAGWYEPLGGNDPETQ